MMVVPDVVTRRIYVKAGKRDNLASIARRHRVSVEQIKGWNDLRGDKLANGQRLELHVPQRAVAAKKVGKKVAAGKVTTRKVAAPAKKAAGKKAVATSKTAKKRT
jgi:membrane-bound lytic murein transglycosylase D